MNLPNLEWFVANANQLTGHIPSLVDDDLYNPNDPMFNAPKLDVLSLAQNNLNGTIPTSLTLLTNLTILQLADNDFSGTIPTTELSSSLRKLEVFWLFGNRDLTGTMPCPDGQDIDKMEQQTSNGDSNNQQNDEPVLDFRADCTIECPCCVECFTT
jgi:hypothetical protein